LNSKTAQSYAWLPASASIQAVSYAGSVCAEGEFVQYRLPANYNVAVAYLD